MPVFTYDIHWRLIPRLKPSTYHYSRMRIKAGNLAEGVTMINLFNSYYMKILTVMVISEYKFKVKHDEGSILLTVTASSEEAAKTAIMAAEHCPESALKLVSSTPLST